MERREPVDIWALLDLCTPWCMHVVATLRIADHIAGGITRINELAAASRCDADSLARVLRHLAGKGVFEEPEAGRFALNEPARALLDSAMRPGPRSRRHRRPHGVRVGQPACRRANRRTGL